MKKMSMSEPVGRKERLKARKSLHLSKKVEIFEILAPETVALKNSA